MQFGHRHNCAVALIQKQQMLKGCKVSALSWIFSLLCWHTPPV